MLLHRTSLAVVLGASFAAAPLYAKKPKPVPAPPLKKMPLCGLTAMGDIHLIDPDSVPDNRMREIFAHPGVYRGSVINIQWKQVEPRQGVYDFSAIDAALRIIAEYNAKYPSTPVAGKLRIYSGPSAPYWLKKLSGGPYHFTVGTGEMDVPGWWTEASRNAWRALQAALAAKYDANPLVGEVTGASCAVLTDESFIDPNSPRSIATLHAAGFNDEKEKACLLGMADDFAVWRLTPVEEIFSPHLVTDSGHVEFDYKLPLEIMQQWRARFGQRAILCNHSVQDPIYPRLRPIYDELKQMGPPIELQTAAPDVIMRGKGVGRPLGPVRTKEQGPVMDWNNVIQNAIDTGANEIEIWTTVDGGGHAPITMAMLQRWAALLKKTQNTTASCLNRSR